MEKDKKKKGDQKAIFTDRIPIQDNDNNEHFNKSENLWSIEKKVFNTALFLPYLKNLQNLIRDMGNDKIKYYVFRNEQQFNQFLIQVLKNITQMTLDSFESKYQMHN